jgi:cytochrome c
MRRFILAAAIVLSTPIAAPAVHAQDAAAGEKVFLLCRACHQIGPNAHNLVGPELNGVIGRKAGSVPGYNYSEANKKSGITWTDKELTAYIKNPQGIVPGTKMAFAGIPNETRIKNLIAFLKQFDASGHKK